ncbi:MAG: hypothetical protein JNJ61_31110 [Anaerolineae bacterium]|nr:hypothetical protein [Anaerolineae bacterium]
MIVVILFILLLLPLFVTTNATTQAQSSSPPPILLVTNSAIPHQYGAYLGEILLAEGISSFETIPIASLSASIIANRDLVILAETPLTSTQATIITNYYNTGGRILSMRPDSRIRGLFALGSPSGTLDGAYLRILNSAMVNGEAPGLGLVSETLQYHGVANLHSTLAGAVVVAQLYDDATTATSFPAVVSTADGRAVAFTYDLARSIVLMRQGNPASANSDNDGDELIRARDLFLSSDGNHWIDRNKIPYPQADEQQRLFARLVRQAVEITRPLPRLWYFPGTARTMLIPTSDSHANPVSWYQTLIDTVEAQDATITIYLSIGAPDYATVTGWRAGGHTFGVHPYANKPDSFPPYNIETLAQGYAVYANWYWSTYSTLPSLSVRHHDLAWLGWSDAAELASSYGLRLDANFFTSGAWLERPDGTWPHGYLTGSGQPMRMVREDGTIINYFQQLTQLVDVQLLCGSNFEELTTSEAVAVSSELIDRSQAGDYAALMAIFHVDCITETPDWIDGTLAYANSLGVPIWNADQWLAFVEARYATDYSNISWDSDTNILSFEMASPGTISDLATIIPSNYRGGNLLSVRVDGNLTSFSTQVIKGRNEAFVVVPGGNHTFTASYAPGTLQPPTIVVPADGYHTSDRRPTFSWLPAEDAVRYEIRISRNNPPQGTIYTITPAPGTTPVTYMPATPLLTTTYYWQIRSVNASNQKSAWSSIRSFVIDSTPGGAPERNLFTTSKPRLSWSRLSDAIGYQIEVSTSSTFATTPIFTAEVGATQLDIETALLPNGTYYWRVRAKRANEIWGAWSAVDTFTVNVQ